MEYEDGFAKTRHTRFCLQYEPGKPGATTNRFTLYKRFNDAD